MCIRGVRVEWVNITLEPEDLAQPDVPTARAGL